MWTYFKLQCRITPFVPKHHTSYTLRWTRSPVEALEHFTKYACLALLEGLVQTNHTLLEGKHSSDGWWIWQPGQLARRFRVCVWSWQHYTHSDVTVFSTSVLLENDPPGFHTEELEACCFPPRRTAFIFGSSKSL